MPITESDYREIIERLTRIETKLESNAPQCASHTERLEKLEGQIGRQNFIASVLGALAAGVVLMLRYMAGK